MSKHQKFPKIVFVSSGYKPVPDVKGGAVEHLMTQLINENEKNPHFNFELYTIEDDELTNIQEYYKYTVIHQVKDFRKTFFLRAYSFLINIFYSLFRTYKRFNYLGLKVVRKLENDVTFILVENDVNIFKQIKNKTKNIPIVFHMHNDFDTFGEMQKNKDSMRFVVDNATEIWTVSKYLKRHLEDNFNTSKIKVFENCIDKARFSICSTSNEKVVAYRNRYRISSNTFEILYSGRLLPQKGVLELLNAVAMLPSDMNFKVVIAGEICNKKYAKKLIKATDKIKDKVVFIGYIPQYEIQTVYASADLVVIPSQCQEAFCLVAMEAASLGKPCIVSKCGALVDVLNEKNSIFIELGKDFEKKLAESIFSVFYDLKLRESMSKESLILSQKFNDEKDYFKNFCNLANEIIKEN